MTRDNESNHEEYLRRYYDVRDRRPTVSYRALVGLRKAALPSLALWALIISVLYMAV